MFASWGTSWTSFWLRGTFYLNGEVELTQTAQ